MGSGGEARPDARPPPPSFRRSAAAGPCPRATGEKNSGTSSLGRSYSPWHLGAIACQQSISQRQQLSSHRPQGTYFLPCGNQDTGHHGLFVHVQADATLVQDVHGYVQEQRPRLAGYVHSQMLTCVLTGEQLVVPAGIRVRLVDRLRGAIVSNDLGASRMAGVLPHVHAWW
jgi:hypothetical protein